MSDKRNCEVILRTTVNNDDHLLSEAKKHALESGSTLNRVIEDALRLATLVVRKGSPLKLVPIPQLIALKLYAGGYKSKADIVELLVRNPDYDLDEIRSVCRQYRLAGIEELISEVRVASDRNQL